jgi:prevent-host-death family protein
MNISRFSEDVKTISDLKVRTTAIIDQVSSTRRPVLLTKRGRGVAVLLDLEEYEKLVDRGRFVEAVEQGMAAMEAGDLHPDSEADAILATFGRDDG